MFGYGKVFTLEKSRLILSSRDYVDSVESNYEM